MSETQLAPSPDWSMVTLKWAGTYLDGSPAAGNITLTYNSTEPMLDEDADTPISVYPSKITLPITTTNVLIDGVQRQVGYVSAQVPASNDPDIAGSGGTYSFTEQLHKGGGRTAINFVADMDAPAGVIWLNRLPGDVATTPAEPLSVIYYAEFSELRGRVAALEAAPGGAIVNDATTDTKGVVELATVNETATGTSPSLATTPAGVKAVADAKVAKDQNLSDLASISAARANLGIGTINAVLDHGLSTTKTGAQNKTALTAAIAAATADNRELFVPTGVYPLDPGVVWDAPIVRFRGAGSKSTVFAFTSVADHGFIFGQAAYVNDLGSQGWVTGFGVKGPTDVPPATPNYKVGITLRDLKFTRVTDLYARSFDIGYTLIGNCYGTSFTDVHARYSKCNVGLNLLSHDENGNDVPFYNCWLSGTKAAVNASGNLSGGFSFFGGQMAGGETLTAADDDAGVVRLGKAYDGTGTTSEIGRMYFYGTLFENPTYVWQVRAFTPFAGLDFNEVTFNAYATGALGLLKQSAGYHDRVTFKNVRVEGTYAALLSVVQGGGGDPTWIEQGTIGRPTVAGTVVDLYKRGMFDRAGLTRGVAIQGGTKSAIYLDGLRLRANGGALERSTDGTTFTTTQSLDTTTDSGTRVAMTPAERTKLSGVATSATANSTDAALRDRSTHTGTQSSATISDFTEAAQDAVAAMLAQGTGVTLTYDDTGNTLTITSTGSGGATDPEVVRDTIGAALIGVGAITVAVNDAADTITISTTATANSTDAQLRDRSTHIGSQPISTITNLQTTLDDKVATAALTTALRTTDAVIRYSGAVPDRSTVTTDTLRRAVWVGTADPFAASKALEGDLWQRV